MNGYGLGLVRFNARYAGTETVRDRHIFIFRNGMNMFCIAHGRNQNTRKNPVWVTTAAKTLKSAQAAATRARGHYLAFAWVGEMDESGMVKILCERDHRGWTYFRTNESQPASDLPA